MILRSLHKLHIQLLVVICVGILYSCGGAASKKDEKKKDEKVNEEVKENLKKILNEVPKPTEIPYLLEATGVDFNEKLPNSPKNAEKYKTVNNTAALNLGVYSADIGYVSVYEKVQDALDYMQAVKSLGDKLGLSNVFEASVIERFKKNLNNKDSLAQIIDGAIKSADSYLKDNERNNIATLIFAGSFLEGLYVSTELVANYPKDKLPEDLKDQILIPLVRVILKQKQPLADLISVLKSLKEEDEQVKKLITGLEELKKMYDDLNIEEKIKNNQGDLIVTDKTIKGITDKVKEIRGIIVG